MPRSGKDRVRVAVLVSGGGSNLEAILEESRKGNLPSAEIVLVVSSKPGVGALERAARYGVPTQVLEPKAFSGEDAFQSAMLASLEASKVEVVCLAGYLKRIGSIILQRFPGRVLNIHPALLPKFGGPGMYGRAVHEAVLRSGDKESGCTVHLVDEFYDHGPILAQARVPVLPKDTPEELAARVLEQEHRLYPRVLSQFCDALISSGFKGASL